MIAPQPPTRSRSGVRNPAHFVRQDCGHGACLRELELPPVAGSNGLIPGTARQEPFFGLSGNFGDLVQGYLTPRFNGSPDAAQSASVRQLRTTAAPAIASRISSVTVEDRADLDRMARAWRMPSRVCRGVQTFLRRCKKRREALP